MGREDLIDDARFDTPAARTQHRAEVDEIVANWTRQHDKAEAWRIVSQASIPAGAVMDTRVLADDQNFVERGIRQTIEHPVVGSYTMSGWPVRFSGKTPPVTPSPLLGEHSAAVLADWLELEGGAIAELKGAKVIAG
jgi:formyl-CoA transferase